MKARWILTTFATAALVVGGCKSMNMSKDKENEEAEGKEVKMSINDIPAAARDSLMRESNNATITTVDKEERHGKTVYEADAMMNGTNWEIVVDGDGKVISKQQDNESKEKGEKDEKEENEKK